MSNLKVKLGDVAHECRQNWHGSQQGVPIVGLEHLEQGEIELKNWDKDIEHTFSKKFQKGQVLLGRRRVYLRKAIFAPCDGICSGDITVIEAGEGILPELLPFVIQNDLFFDYAMRGSAGSLSPRVKWDYLKNYEFSLPPLPEQKVLAEKLWAAYRLKEAYKKLLAATDEMVKAKFVEMLGEIKTQKQLELKKLRDIVHPDCPISYGIVQPGDGIENGIPVVRPVDLNPNLFVYRNGLKMTSENISNLYKRTILRGDELLLCVRGTTGIMGIATEELRGCNVTRGITPLFFKEGVNRIYILCVFLSDETQKYIADNTIGSALKNINMDKVREMPIPLPPIEQQNKFEKIFIQTYNAKTALQKSIESIDSVIKSLINK